MMHAHTVAAAALACIFFTPPHANAQTTVSDLPPAHAAALQAYIERNPSLKFLPETAMDKEVLTDIRKHFGASLMPYYRRGDFNRDGLQDFAVVLARHGTPIRQEGITSETHLYRHPIAVVIFNGQRRGGYRVAFSKRADAPLVSFLSMTVEKKKRLYFGVYATDEGFIMTPTGRGYLVEYPD